MNTNLSLIIKLIILEISIINDQNISLTEGDWGLGELRWGDGELAFDIFIRLLQRECKSLISV